MYKTLFTIDCFASSYVGFTDGTLWNEWATPHLEVNEAFAVMHDYNKQGWTQIAYDENTDTFWTYANETKELVEWKGKNYNTGEGIKHLYAIGLGQWGWRTPSIKQLAEQTEEFIYCHCTHKYWSQDSINRHHITSHITKQLENSSTLYEVICIMNNEELDADERFKKLRGALNI